ncbi:MAG: fabG 6 [Acidimicrobiaceae bacterium]|nr:fabG 6 [Acidimicrobiaceae bacterium]
MGTALVTGAGRGIGREVACRLATLGWDVGITSRSGDELAQTAELIRAEGARVVSVTGDVSKPSDVETVCSAVEAELGAVSVLVNNAAVSGEHARTYLSDPDEWWHAMEINLRGPFLYSLRLVPAMVDRQRGYVVNINSLDCSRSADAGSPVYSISKTALGRFTEIQDAELYGSGVVTFGLSPGLVRTAMGGGRPDADELPADSWLPASAAADKVEQLISGRYDALHGRFLHANDELDVVVDSLAAAPDARFLRLIPAGPADSILAYGAATSHRDTR